MLLVFALINRPDIFDLRPGSSFVEFLLEEGFDVFLLDWGYPEEEDSDMGLENYVCDEMTSGIREVLRCSGQDEVSLLGWCIGGTLCLMYGGTQTDNPVRNMVLLTTPVDTRGALYTTWVGRESFDVDYVADALPGDTGCGDRLGEQVDEAGHQLLDDLPSAVGGGAGRTAATRGLSSDGALDRGQPDVSRTRLQGVDHMDVQGEPPGPQDV